MIVLFKIFRTIKNLYVYKKKEKYLLNAIKSINVMENYTQYYNTGYTLQKLAHKNDTMNI